VRVSEPVLSADEAQRRNRSLWAKSKISHAQMLANNAQPIGETLTVRSMCAFTANGKAGVPVAVVVDGEREYEQRAMSRIAERCIESSVVVLQPYGLGSRASSRIHSSHSEHPPDDAQAIESPKRPGTQGTLGSRRSGRGSYVAKFFLLTPGGPSSRTMSASMALAGMSVLLEHPFIQFAQIMEDQLYAVKVSSPLGEAWDETLDVRIGDDGAIWVKVPNPKIEMHVAPEDVCEALNINMLSLQMDMPVQVVSSVARHILIPLRSRRQMHDLDPYWDLVSDVCCKYNTEGFHLFSLDPVAGGSVHTRNLSPLVRLEEEAASPSANAALTGYIHFHRILPIDSQERFICEQGWALGMKQRPSKVYVELELAPAASHLEPFALRCARSTKEERAVHPRPSL
jgi:predicted PhzF superfamily epimerase YddE/YHI9